jgi:hypothetical protein
MTLALVNWRKQNNWSAGHFAHRRILSVIAIYRQLRAGSNFRCKQFAHDRFTILRTGCCGFDQARRGYAAPAPVVEEGDAEQDDHQPD